MTVFWVSSWIRRRDKMVLKFAIVSLFFAACFLTQFPHQSIRSDPEICGKMLQRRAGTKSPQWNMTIQKIMDNLETNWMELSKIKENGNTVMISGLRTHQINDPFVENYARALRTLGYRVEYGTERNGSYLGQQANRDALPVTLCLEEECSKASHAKTNHISGFATALVKMDKECLCPLGTIAGALECRTTFRPSDHSTTSETIVSTWVVTQGPNPPTFVTVSPSVTSYFQGEMAKISGVVGKKLLQQPLSILERPVRMSLYVLAIGNPGFLYVHRSGLVRIGNYMALDHGLEHDSQLHWGLPQFRRYLATKFSTAVADKFLLDVQSSLANCFDDFGAVYRKWGGKSGPCSSCYQLLEVNVFINSSLAPYIVAISDHTHQQGAAVPARIIQDILSLLLSQPAKEHVQDAYSFLEVVEDSFAIQEECTSDRSGGSCITASELTIVGNLMALHGQASQYDFDFLGAYSADSEELEEMMKSGAACITKPYYGDFVDVEEHLALGNRATFSARCQKDSLFRSLLAGIILSDRSLRLAPAFHPLTVSYTIQVPHSVLQLEIDFVPTDCETDVVVQGESESFRKANFTVGIGENVITVHVTKKGSTSGEMDILKTYTLKLARPSRESSGADIKMNDTYEMCHIRQSCQLKIFPREPCGLQLETSENIVSEESGKKTCDVSEARWIVACRGCDDETSCDWKKATWSAEVCQNALKTHLDVGECLRNKKLIFIGDSTNRGILTYLLDQFNGSLWEDEKTHSVKSYVFSTTNSTFVFGYYPQFWLSQHLRPTFRKTVYQALKETDRLQNNSNTVLVVGGVQFLQPSHLADLKKALTRRGLEGATVIVKTLGAGFFVPARGVLHVGQKDVSSLWERNEEIIRTARENNFDFVDTFAMTTSRFEEFHPGKCSCHFHSVEQTNSGPQTNQRTYAVRGPINEVYSQQVLRKICAV